MKKVISVMLVVLCILYVFLPACCIIGLATEYHFALRNYAVSIIIITFISLLTAVLLFKSKSSISKANSIVISLLLPLSIIGGLCFILKGEWNLTFIFVLICCSCCTAMFIKFSRPFALKLISIILSIFLTLFSLFGSFIHFAFGDFFSNTVVKSATSPNNFYIAEVIDNDQGALGGNTLVTITDIHSNIDLFVGEFTKPRVRIYSGEWSEFNDMEISWKDNDTLLINGKEYSIKT